MIPHGTLNQINFAAVFSVNRSATFCVCENKTGEKSHEVNVLHVGLRPGGKKRAGGFFPSKRRPEETQVAQ